MVLDTGLVFAAAIPVIVPVVESIDRPLGNVVADQVGENPAFGIKADWLKDKAAAELIDKEF